MRWKFIAIIVLIILTIGFIFFLNTEQVEKEIQNTIQINNEVIESDSNPINQIEEINNECNNITYNFPPVNLDKTAVVVPFGLMSGNHVTPIDHQYFQNFNNEEANIEVYSPTKGIVRDMQHMSGSYFDSKTNKEIEWADYRIEIEHDCKISSIYIHIDKLSDKLAAVAPPKGEYKRVEVEVDAGEVIGWYSNNVDYNLADKNFYLEGFINPEHYSNEPWKIHVPNTFNYFNDEIKEKMISKSQRVDEPIAGKFDYDIDGKLIGNWFLEGTNGYAGIDQEDYWIGHLSISPDYIDPSHFIFSIGDYQGEPQQFGVKGNSPFPSNVSVDSGLIKYELVRYEYYINGKPWDRISLEKGLKAINQDNEVLGVVLLELIENRTLKIQVFPRKTANNIQGFTSNAKIYER